MRLILIGNFQPDKQESMNRFALMLNAGFRIAGIQSEIWYPRPIFSNIATSTHAGLGKWLGYIDKWLLFPLILRWKINRQRLNKSGTFFHVCDHSNAPYLRHLPTDRSAITCHDVLAIRGALGYEDAYCPASGLGKILQKWILHYLLQAQRIMCVSNLTLNQLRALSLDKTIEPKNWQTIHIGFNADFRPVEAELSTSLLHKAGIDPTLPFLLQVGSGLPRKNRKLLLDMAAALGDQWQGQICYAGQNIDTQLLAHAKSLGLERRIVSVLKPDHETLLALYGTCEALIFPSFSEGFGWPVIEAQACGAPVIASAIEPMPEVSGGAALHADPADPFAFASAFLTLQDEVVRDELIKRGFENCKRFSPEVMIATYLAAYETAQNE